MKKLKYVNFQTEPGPLGARALLTLKFLDDVGDAYSWMPRWSDAEQLFLKAISIESFNKPESEWLPRFARTVKETAESVNQPIDAAYKVKGTLAECREGKLVLECGSWNNDETHLLLPLFPITFEFLDNWLGSHVEALVINGVTVQLRDTIETYATYPPREPRQTTAREARS